MADAIAVALGRSGYACRIATRGEEALAIFREHGADVVISDRRMPGMSGDELMAALLAEDATLPIILVTAFGDVRSAVGAIKAGAFDYVIKPFDHDELRGLVARALELQRLKRENALLRREVAGRFTQDVIAESRGMRDALERVDRAAPSEVSVLIRGESGTGKEVVAKRLHYQSGRVGKPFVAVNCKAFAPGVLESELFGHEKGAFTGATNAREGCFERAHGGTLFLDEIGEVDTDFQAKLLRALQEGEVQRVGGEAPRPVDVRIVAATNRDLKQAIAEGAFREDLFYRLNVIPVELPPLRRRRADVLPLAHHFLDGVAARGGPRLTLSMDAETALGAHSWPGNVRELENAIERAVVLARGPGIEPEDLLLDDLPGSFDEPMTDTAAGDGTFDHGTLQTTIDEASRMRIRAALAAHDGHRTNAAAELGIDRTTLFRLLKRLDP